jgi:hypothetical protein
VEDACHGEIEAQCGDGCPGDIWEATARVGCLQVVRWLHEHRAEGCTSSAMNHAAMNGHFEMVRWLHVHRAEEGCIQSAIDGAARNRLFVIVRWLQQAHDTVPTVWSHRGCQPPSKSTIDGMHVTAEIYPIQLRQKVFQYSLVRPHNYSPPLM